MTAFGILDTSTAMPEPKLDIAGISIVFVGNFNPTILQPYWLADQELIRKEEAKTATIEIIHPEGTAITIGNLKVSATSDRFSVQTEDASAYETARDLAMGVMKLLPHTPVRAMGINSDVHYIMPTEESWHALGDEVAPKEFWSNILHKTGLRSLTMEGQRQDGFKGFIRVRIEPSLRVKTGVFIQVNDHYVPNIEDAAKTDAGIAQTPEEQPGSTSEDFVDILRSNWSNFLELKKRVNTSIMRIKDESGTSS